MSSSNRTEAWPRIESESHQVQIPLRAAEIDHVSQIYPQISLGKFTLERLSFIRIIGSGSYGTVRLTQDKESGKALAVKEIAKAKLQHPKKVARSLEERAILASIRHPLIVDFYGACQDERKLYLVMEYVQGGDLYSLLSRRGRLATSEVRFYAAEVTSVLAYLHSQGVVYRDLKLENVLIAQSGHIKLTDFGWSKRLRQGERTFTLCGTPEYLAPEMITRSGHDFTADWWTLGILLHEMLCGTTPFHGESAYEVYSNIITAAYLPPKEADNETRLLLQGLLSKDPQHRFTAEKVRSQSFFSVVNWDHIEPIYVPVVKGDLDDSNFQYCVEDDNESEEITSNHEVFRGY
jgi:serine/threonine protein kinase